MQYGGGGQRGPKILGLWRWYHKCIDLNQQTFFFFGQSILCTFFFLCKDNFLYRNFYTNRKKEIFLTAGACVNNSFLYVFCSSIYAYILLNLNTVFYVHVTMTFSKQFQHFLQTYRIFLTNLMLYVYYILIAKVFF